MEQEKRRARRFDLSLPVTLLEPIEQKPMAVAQTKDISSNGLMLELDEEMRAGSQVVMVVTLPREITQSGPVQLRCYGNVVRNTRAANNRVAIAVAIERYDFMRSAEGAAN